MDLFTFDDEYVRRLRAGDRETEEHFCAYVTELLRLKLRKRVDREVVDDYVQDVLFRVLRAIKVKNEPADGRKLGAYVIAVCNNRVAEGYRVLDRTEPLGDKFDPPSNDLPVDDEIDKREKAERVRRVLTMLTEKDAAILRAIFFEERDKDEICSEFGVDRGYLRVLVHRALGHFRSIFLR